MNIYVDPTHLSGVVRVTINHGGAYDVFFCDLNAGLCSCGDTSGACAHAGLATESGAVAPPLYPDLSHRNNRRRVYPIILTQ